MTKLKKIIFVLIVSFLFVSTGNAVIKDSIFATVGNKVITKSDIINEIKIILILNGTSYSEEIKDQLDQSAIQSIIKRTIKKIEIEKYDSLRFNPKDVDDELGQLASNLNIDLDTLEQTLIANRINLSVINDQISTDLLWNSLIFLLYKDRLSINLDEIVDELQMLDQNKEINEYLISEIIIKPILKENLEVKLKEIYNEIETKGFDNVAIEKSISETAIKGGDLGWINENTIAKEFREKIVKTSIGKISEPIFLPQGILFFKIRDKRTLKKFISLEDTKNQLVGAKKMKILNMYSLSHYDKLIRNISIVYY